MDVKTEDVFFDALALSDSQRLELASELVWFAERGTRRPDELDGGVEIDDREELDESAPPPGAPVAARTLGEEWDAVRARIHALLGRG